MADQNIQTYICEIQKTLTEFASLPESRQKLADARADIEYHYRYWTSGVIRRIGCIGEQERFEVYSTFHSKERLYDLCWVEKDGGLTKSLPLALECEWDHFGNINRYRREIEYDFEKLLWSCALLRVMIFECWLPETDVDTVKCKAEAEIGNLIRRIEAFSSSQSEAIYLFFVGCTYKAGNEYIFGHYPVLESDPVVGLKLDETWRSKDISGFTFEGKTHELKIKKWNEFLVKVCEILSEDNPLQFRDVLEEKPRHFKEKRSGFPRSASSTSIKKIGNTGIYVHTGIDNDQKKKLLQELVEYFKCNMPVPYINVNG